MSITIRSIRLDDAPSFRETLQSVAQERRYILTTDAPALKSVHAFVNNNIEKGYPQFVAEQDNNIIGWADFVPVEKESLMHCASLGMGVLEPWRGQGLGEKLLHATTKAAIDFGFTRLQLEVFSSNTEAVSLYKKHNFEIEGCRPQARCLDGEYFDILMMGRLVNADSLP